MSLNKFHASVVLFNTLAGRTLSTEVDEKFWKDVENQAERVLEEAKELYAAVKARDLVETLDGYCDVFVTNTFVGEMLSASGVDIDGALHAVCQNNLSKIPKDIFRAAESAEMYGESYAVVDRVVVNGEEYFPVKRREDDKLLKPKYYHKVHLNDFIGGNNK